MKTVMNMTKITLFYKGAHIDFIAREPKEQVIDLINKTIIYPGAHSVSFLGRDGDYIILPWRVLQQATIHIKDAVEKLNEA